MANYQYQLHEGILYQLPSYSTFCFYAHFWKHIFLVCFDINTKSMLNAVFQEEIILPFLL